MRWLLISLGIICLSGRELHSQNTSSSWVGKPFPATVFTDASHRIIDTEKLHDSILVINCWSIHCGACVAEIPDLNRLVDSFRGKKVVWLGLTYDQLPEMEAFFRSQQAKKTLQMEHPVFKFQLVGGQKDFLTNTLRVGVYPMTFIIGTDGAVLSVMKGVRFDKDGKPGTYVKMRSALDRWIM